MILISGCIMLLACEKSRTFDSALWKQKGLDWQMDPLREKMALDLLRSDTLRGMTRVEVRELLGKADYEDQNLSSYLVLEKYESGDIDPVAIIRLEVYFAVDSLVNRYRLTDK